MNVKTIKSDSRLVCFATIRMLVGVALFLFQDVSWGQCLSYDMQTKTGVATRSKIGQMCLSGDPCPTNPPEYFLSDKTVRHWDRSSITGCTCFYTTTENYDSTYIITYTLPNSDPTNDACPTGGSSTWSFTGSYSSVPSGCPDMPPSTSATYDKTLEYWIDQDSNYVEDPWSWIGLSSGWVQTNLTCDSSLVVMTGTNFGSGSVTETLTNLYSTATLESTVDGYAKARIATNFVAGDAISANSLGSEEFCASAMRSKWRIPICGTDPKTRYTIAWVIHIYNKDGTNAPTESRAPMQSEPVQGQPGLWYYPSEAGADVPAPTSWASGCLGGTRQITYEGPVTVTPNP